MYIKSKIFLDDFISLFLVSGVIWGKVPQVALQLFYLIEVDKLKWGFDLVDDGLKQSKVTKSSSSLQFWPKIANIVVTHTTLTTFTRFPRSIGWLQVPGHTSRNWRNRG